MIHVTVEGEAREFEEETLLMDVAALYQRKFEYDILLARVNGKLQELHKRVKDGTEITFLTAKDRPGIMTYQRSAVLILLKAIYEVIGKERLKKVAVDFSIGNGLFMEPIGEFEVTPEMAEKIRDQMRAYVNASIPIMKRSMNTDEAVELFHQHKMYDKERLFHYRRVSRVNIYSIGKFEDYNYGYMVQNTGYIQYFDVIAYRHGLVLLLPDSSNPTKIPEFQPQEKLFSVLIQEARMEKKMGDIAEMIKNQPDKKFVMIAGPSSSGKTTFSHRLSIQLRANGLVPHPISVDNYFVNRVNSPKNPDGSYNYEVLECLDVEKFNQDMTDLLEGKTVQLPVYNFVTGEREYQGDWLTLGENDILVIEGIHCLNERLSYSLPRENKFKIYISALTQIGIDEHNRIPTTDGRLIRRIVRDARTRGASAQDTIRMWPSVRRGEEENIFPYQEEADVMFNSALVYELAVLKQFAEPALFSVPRDSAEYVEAKRLLKFLDYFLGVGCENIPQNSILREFVGGSCFRV